MDSELKLTRTGMVTRLGLMAIVLLVTLTGTFFGSDASFPFGPFKMYSYRNDPNGMVNSLRLEGVDEHGALFSISAGDLGLRRAELEGTLPRIESDPALLDEMAERYHENNPDEPPLAELHVVVRHTQLKDGKETDQFVDEIKVVWKSP